jgi:putative hydrolase of the HAD superfamily
MGNVLLNFKPEILLLKLTGEKERTDSFIRKIIHNKTWVNLDRGTLTQDEALKIYLSQYPEEKDLLIPFFDQWINYLTPIHENVETLRKLKKLKYKIYLLSNAIIEAYNILKNRHDFYSLFDGQIISGFEKVIKPEKQIYDLLLKRFNLIPEESLFIDDTLGNLRPAKKLGMKTIWLKPDTDLKKELRKFQIMI